MEQQINALIMWQPACSSDSATGKGNYSTAAVVVCFSESFLALTFLSEVCHASFLQSLDSTSAGNSLAKCFLVLENTTKGCFKDTQLINILKKNKHMNCVRKSRDDLQIIVRSFLKCWMLLGSESSVPVKWERRGWQGGGTNYLKIRYLLQSNMTLALKCK